MHKKVVLIWNITFILDSSLANVGDKALLHSIAGSFKKSKALKNVELNLLVHDRSYINQHYPEIVCCETKGFFKKLKIFSYIKRCDYFIYGGGEGFQNVSSSIFLLLNLSLGYIALLLGKKIVCYSSGVGQGFELVGIGKVLTGFLLRRAKLITVRDKQSADALLSMRISPKIIKSGADPALIIDKKSVAGGNIDQDDKILNKKNTVCLAPRLLHFYTNKNILEKMISLLPIDTRIRYRLIPKKFFREKEKLINSLADIADRLVERLNCKVILLPMYSGRISPHDEVLCAEVYSKMKKSKDATIARSNLTIVEIIKILRSCDLVVAMPLHTLILSSLYNTPAIAINYQTKGQRFMESIEQNKNSFYLRDIMEKVPVEKVIDRAEKIMSAPSNTRMELKLAVAKEQKKAKNNFYLIEKLICFDEKN